jgi:ABC-type multidrug transport system ATPase subunit
LQRKKRKDIYVDNMIAFVGQNDYHAPRLTVKETFDFAFQCKSGGTHVPKQFVKTAEQREMVRKLDKADAYPTAIEKVLGLDGVANTFVGNNEIRGVSGGQRRRVTTGEMVQAPFPILCADELSTGLDSSSTFSICNAIMHFTQVQSRVRILSLLQPSPETVALFDEIILIAEGKILYSGPVGEIEDYFARLGYVAPDTMDVADFCQVISSPDGAKLYKQPEGSPQETPYTVDELAAAFQRSDQYQKVLNIQKGPWANTWTSDTMDSVNSTPMTTMLHQRFRNSGESGNRPEL